MATKQWSARPENAGAVGVCETHGYKSAAHRQINTLRLFLKLLPPPFRPELSTNRQSLVRLGR